MGERAGSVQTMLIHQSVHGSSRACRVAAQGARAAAAHPAGLVAHGARGGRHPRRGLPRGARLQARTQAHPRARRAPESCGEGAASVHFLLVLLGRDSTSEGNLGYSTQTLSFEGETLKHVLLGNCDVE